MRRIGSLAVVAIILAGVASAFDFKPREETQSADEFIQLRSQVFAVIQQQFDADFPGAKHPGPRKKIHFVKTPAENERDRKEIAKGEWQSHASYQWFLDLNDEALPEGQQSNSETMCSTQLLNHYCEGLKQLGFRNQGSPSVAVSAVQCSSNEWFREGHRQQLSISTVVFVAPAARQGIVRIEIREDWPN